MAEAGFYADKIDVHGDGTVVIYRRADAAKKGVWQARIRIPGATGYTTRSTKETDEQRARAKALELRDDALVNVKLGLKSRSGSSKTSTRNGIVRQKAISRNDDERINSPKRGDTSFPSLLMWESVSL